MSVIKKHWLKAIKMWFGFYLKNGSIWSGAYLKDSQLLMKRLWNGINAAQCIMANVVVLARLLD